METDWGLPDELPAEAMRFRIIEAINKSPELTEGGVCIITAYGIERIADVVMEVLTMPHGGNRV